MEIKPHDNLPVPGSPEKTTHAVKTTDRAFGAVLEEVLSHSNKIAEGRKKTQFTNNISTAHWHPSLPGEERFVVERAERLLDTLDEYQRKLASPEFTLREIFPLVREIEAENEILGSAISRLPQGNELKQMLNQVIIISSIEMIKFNRGDYINP